MGMLDKVFYMLIGSVTGYAGTMAYMYWKMAKQMEKDFDEMNK